MHRPCPSPLGAIEFEFLLLRSSPLDIAAQGTLDDREASLDQLRKMPAAELVAENVEPDRSCGHLTKIATRISLPEA